MASGGSAAQFPLAWYKGAPDWVMKARDEIGTREKLPNGKSNPVVLAYFADSGNGYVKDAIGTPWCAAWIGSVVKRAGHKPTGSLMARSYLHFGTPTKSPKVGAICVMWRGKKDDGFTGHVALFVRKDANYVYCLGGNQGDMVCEQRFPLRKVLGYRNFPDVAKPVDVTPADPAPAPAPTPAPAVGAADPAWTATVVPAIAPVVAAAVAPASPPVAQRSPVAFPGALASMAWTTTVEKNLAAVSRKVTIIGRVRKFLHAVWATILSLFTLENLGIAKSWIDGIKDFAGDNVALLGIVGAIAGLALLSYLLSLIGDDAEKGNYVPSGVTPVSVPPQ